MISVLVKSHDQFRWALRRLPAHVILTGWFTGILCCAVHLCGAVDEPAEYTEPPITEEDRNHWAFRPVQQVPVANNSDSMWPRNEIDYFIQVELERNQLTPQPTASPQTLIRRLSFDLIGLPPSPQDVDAYMESSQEDSYRKLVDRLLQSPRYGERWAQHWLDVARFAETDGYEHDNLRPAAWMYRDWVIQALNEDLPYNDFIRQQIAGDEICPDSDEASTATYFCLCGPDMPDINLIEERRHTLLNEIVAAVGESILGLQVGCAQCHDHRYDAISQADFYRVRAVFEPAVQLKKRVSISTLHEQRPFEQTSHLMLRGDFQSPGPEVTPDVLRVLQTDQSQMNFRNPRGDTSVRPGFAEWLVSPDNPLTARVIVNRIWQHHFGTGLVSTSNDFGVMGAKPSHPELLDWLAAYLMEQGWNLKQLHRKIVMSATYRQRSFLSDNVKESERTAWLRSLKTDPDQRLLSRYPRRRLEGEAIRDAILSASGQLNLRVGGPGVRPPLPQELVATLLTDQWNETEDSAEHMRRSIYVFARRNLRYPIFEVFDRPSANTSCGLRGISTTAPQSLHLLNSEFTLMMAQHMSQLVRNVSPDRETQIQLAFRRTLSRRATPGELRRMHQLWDGGSLELQDKSEPLTHLCLSLFNSNEFVFID